jgi:hypothetical protein
MKNFAASEAVCMNAIQILLAAALFAATLARAMPAMPEIPVTLSDGVRQLLIAKRQPLALRKLALIDEANAINKSCASVEKGSSQHQSCLARQKQFNDAVQALSKEMDELADEIDAAAARQTIESTKYFYALQTRTLTTMADGGHPIDAPGSPPVGLHGLVGGTTWTYGFRRPQVKCEEKCRNDMKRNLESQLTLFCSSQSDPKKCLADGLPFTPEMYDMAVSMGSSHAAIEDLATRVLFDGASFGEFSRKNKEIFASLKGRQFDTLDCHSNGALLCLAALRSGDTQAKEVRLFGPQMSPEAAKRWQEYAANTNTTIKIYINNGDPIPALSWKQPTPQTPAGKAATAAWLNNPVTGPATFADALFHTYFDSKTGAMDATLRNYGFDVTRSKCMDAPDFGCHSMKLYERQLKEKSADSSPK